MGRRHLNRGRARARPPSRMPPVPSLMPLGGGGQAATPPSVSSPQHQMWKSHDDAHLFVSAAHMTAGETISVLLPCGKHRIRFTPPTPLASNRKIKVRRTCDCASVLALPSLPAKKPLAGKGDDAPSAAPSTSAADRTRESPVPVAKAPPPLEAKKKKKARPGAAAAPSAATSTSAAPAKKKTKTKKAPAAAPAPATKRARATAPTETPAPAKKKRSPPPAAALPSPAKRARQGAASTREMRARNDGCASGSAPGRVVVGQRVSAQWGSDADEKWFDGVVTHVHPSGHVDVLYNDKDVEKHKSAARVRPMSVLRRRGASFVGWRADVLWDGDDPPTWFKVRAERRAQPSQRARAARLTRGPPAVCREWYASGRRQRVTT